MVATKHSHGFGEQARDLLAALVVSSTDAAFVKLLLGAQLPITARLDAFALDTDRRGVRGARGAIHNLNQVSKTSCCISLSHIPSPPSRAHPTPIHPRGAEEMPAGTMWLFAHVLLCRQDLGVSEKRWMGLHPFSSPNYSISCPFHCRERAAQETLLTPSCSVHPAHPVCITLLLPLYPNHPPLSQDHRNVPETPLHEVKMMFSRGRPSMD